LAIKADLGALKARLRAAGEIGKNAGGAEQSRVPASRSASPSGEPATEQDDLAAFRAAVAGVAPLPPDNRVQLAKAKPRRVTPPRPRDEEAAKAPKPSRDIDIPAHWHNAGSLPRPVLPRDPDADLFARAVAGIQPLPDCNRVVLGKPLPAPRPQQSAADERAALHESLHGQIGLQDRLEGGDEPNYLRSGIAANTLRDLRRGRWVIQSEIDLHGLNREEARQQLATWLAASLHHGLRCVRVVHGKGLSSPQKTSVLRHLVRGWLAQRDEVLAYCQAKPQDGGEGALIVLLRAPKRLRNG
jgi:DNA-nicking Smr family endonuclease